MLKYKIKKSKRNIISLLDSVKDEEEMKIDEAPQYSEINPRRKKLKQKKARIGSILMTFPS